MTRWQAPLLVGFCSGLLGVLSGISVWAGGAFFNAIARGSFWAALVLGGAAIADAGSMALPMLFRPSPDEGPPITEEA